MNGFECKVLSGLNKGSECRHLGFAVSGGADSISLLTAVCQLYKEKKISAEKIFVITVNHFIRPDEETCGDADFVINYCKSLEDSGLPVEAECYALGKGQVQELAQKRGGGIEEAARFLRYEAFKKFIEQKQLDFLCLAHNQNDQLETLLMRFLQGSSGSAASGIKAERNKFLRPLLNITRTEIEDYLTAKKIAWRTDSTNEDTDYLRNKIRHKLIPVLNEQFEGWQTGVMTGAEKQQSLSESVNQLVESIAIIDNSVSAEDFCKYGLGVQIPLLLRMCNAVSQNCRIPYSFLKNTCEDILNCIRENKHISNHFSDVEIVYKCKKINVKKYVKTETDLCFFDIIEETGKYEFPFGSLSFSTSDSNRINLCWNDGVDCTEIELPVCVRNAQPGDVVKTADGNYKKVSEIYSNWKVGEDKTALIPVIQDLSEKQEIKCILGSCAGFNNWIVKE